MPKTAITISRQLGSGGAQVGQILAARLGFRYIDREILRLTAEALGVEETDLSRCDERVASFWERILEGYGAGVPDAPYVPPPVRPFNEQVFEAECQVIRHLADCEDCVVVGRGGVRILRDHPRAVHVLLHAPTEFRIRRVIQVYQAASEAQARSMIADSDRAREAFFRERFGMSWLTAPCYHLSLDTSVLRLDDVAAIIEDTLRRRFP